METIKRGDLCVIVQSPENPEHVGCQCTVITDLKEIVGFMIEAQRVERFIGWEIEIPAFPLPAPHFWTAVPGELRKITPPGDMVEEEYEEEVEA